MYLWLFYDYKCVSNNYIMFFGYFHEVSVSRNTLFATDKSWEASKSFKREDRLS